MAFSDPPRRERSAISLSTGARSGSRLRAWSGRSLWFPPMQRGRRLDAGLVGLALQLPQSHVFHLTGLVSPPSGVGPACTSALRTPPYINPGPTAQGPGRSCARGHSVNRGRRLGPSCDGARTHD